MNSKIDAAMTKGVSKALRIFLLLLVVVYFALSIAYVVVSHTFVAGIGIIPITISGVLSLSELGVLDRVLPKTNHEYNIVLGDGVGQKSAYKLRTPWRLCLDIILVISFLLIVITMIIEMTVLPYYFSVAAAFLGSYCTMPLLLGIMSHLTLAVMTIADMLKSSQLCAQCAGRMGQGHEGGHRSAVGSPQGASGPTA